MSTVKFWHVFCTILSLSFYGRSGPGPLGPVRKILVVWSGVFKILEKYNLRERWKQVSEILERWKQVFRNLREIFPKSSFQNLREIVISERWKQIPEILERWKQVPEIACKVCPIENNTNLKSNFCLIKSSKIDFIFLSAFYLIIWLMA